MSRGSPGSLAPPGRPGRPGSGRATQVARSPSSAQRRRCRTRASSDSNSAVVDGAWETPHRRVPDSPK